MLKTRNMIIKFLKEKINEFLKRKEIDKNYQVLVKRMLAYHNTVNYLNTPFQNLLLAIIDIENAKNSGKINSMYEIVA